MLDYNYVSKGTLVRGTHCHKPFNIVDDNNHIVGGGVDIQSPDGLIFIRITNYNQEMKNNIRELFNVKGINEVTFNNAYRPYK